MPASLARRLPKFALVLLLLGAAAQPSCKRKDTGQGAGGSGAGPVEEGKVVQQASRKAVVAFESEKELVGFLDDLAKAREKDARRRSGSAGPGGSPPPAAAPAAEAADQAKSGEESVTNVQHAGVDEGGIVKVHGEMLVVLRRGRLFTVGIANGSLTPISSIDAFGPDVSPSGAWYDEMLISGNTVVVIGFSYQRGGTEIGLFDIDAEGKLTYRATYHLRSNDYYSSRNYASRLLGSKLVFYTPLYVRLDPKQPLRSFPALRKWHAGATEDDFKRIAAPTNVYRPIVPSPSLALHTVTVCDLGARELECSARAVMGPPGRVFYVSPSSVYVWMTHYPAQADKPDPRSLLYRMPLDGSEPTVLRVRGAPVDQLSFLEDPNKHLNVLVRADAAGDGMWRAEVTQGDVALMRVPLDSFTASADDAAPARYAPLPKPSGYTFQNRFVGDFVLYGSGSGWGAAQESAAPLFAYRYAGGGQPVTLRIGHGTDRIEALGRNAIVVGTDGRDLHFTPIALGSTATVAERYTRKGASQGELRTHGFFYKPGGERSGLLGLPIREPGRPGYEHLFRDSASILFLENKDLNLSELGALGARAEGAVNDGCRASCVDWYGNARPLFLRGRIFALLGYELVEGELVDGRIREKRRASFAPTPTTVAR